jgi:putative glycosyltransferase
MKLSIVATLYRSAPYIQEFYQRVCRVASQIVGDDFEIILVNDGSPDNSLAVAVELSRQDSRVCVVDLSRNFGHHKAMMTGLSYSCGEHVFLIDSDLEEEPEWLLTFHELLNKHLVDVVFGVQAKRRNQLFEKISGIMFYRLFRFLTGVAQPDNIVTARLMTRRYVDALLLHREREVNIGGLWLITGFAQLQYSVQKHATSPTTYNFIRKVEHFVNAVTSFSNAPLTFIFYLGSLILMMTLFYVTYLAYRYIFVSQPPDGYTSLIVSVWLLAGLVIFSIGVLGIYLSKVFSEVKQRPYTIVRDVYKSTTKES